MLFALLTRPLVGNGANLMLGSFELVEVPLVLATLLPVSVLPSASPPAYPFPSDEPEYDAVLPPGDGLLPSDFSRFRRAFSAASTA